MTLSIRKILLLKALLVFLAFAGLLLPGIAFASLSTGNSSNLDQANFRWRYDNGSEFAATWRADTNIDITDVSVTETSLRIRLNIKVPDNRVSVAVQPRLEFSDDATTCLNGSWNTIGAQAGAPVWRLKASGNFTDGDDTTPQISSDTFVTGDIYDSTQTGASVTIVGNSESTEIEWSIEANSPANSTTYRFRASDNSVAFGAYTNCAALTTEVLATTTFIQNHYAWYVNPGTPSENVTDLWGDPNIGEDNIITPVPVSNDPPNTTQELRLRTNITVNDVAIGVNERWFKLQFRTGTDSDCSTGTWTDVGAAAGGEAFIYTSDTSVADDTTLTVAKLTNTDRLETYSRVKPANTPTGTSALGEDIEFDFHFLGTNSTSAERYLFRVFEANSDGTDKAILSAYTNCPILHTEPGTGDLLRHGNIFSGESEQGFFWAD
jgi:hypothetical protein